MKYLIIIAFSLLMLFDCSCKGKKNPTKYENCMPGVIIIGYLGESDKSKYPLLIRTDEKDSTYLKYVGVENEKFKLTGFPISKEYYRASIIKPESYSLLKTYIISHNTNKIRSIFSANNNTIKIMLFDRCDTLSYSVDQEDVDYFTRMVDTLRLNANDTLGNYIKYYHYIQNWNGLH